jgi:Bacterial Ig-like domain (group 3)
LLNLFATLTTTQLANGPNTITAVYSGDANFNGSTATPSVLLVGNPDFQLAANPGNLTVSGSTPAKSTLVLVPGPGLSLTGTVLFTCAGLPAGVTCSFQPPQLNLDGFTTANDTLTISKTAGQSAFRLALHQPRLFGGFLGGLGAACFFLLAWPRKKRCWPVILLFFSCLLVAIGCSGGSNSPGNGSGPAANSYVVTVTATGGSGARAVSHTVTLAVTVQ